MKKLLIILTSILLSMSLTACGSSNDDSKPESGNTDQQSDTVQTTPETTPEPEKTELTYGDTFTFDGFELTIYDSIEWTTVENRYSERNGSDVVLVPVHVKNNSGETGHINIFYINVFGSKGTELESVSSYFDNILGYSGDLRDGAETDAYLAVLYDGDGDYYVEFDNISEKVEVKLPITK